MSGRDTGCARGDKYIEQADNIRDRCHWCGITLQPDLEDAADLYEKAAAQYKISGLFDNAGECYANAAECNMQTKDDITAKSNWQESGKCYSKSDYQKAIESYKNAVEINLNSDRFIQAAKIEEEIGDMFYEDGHYNDAIKSFEKSAEYFEADNDIGSKNKRLIKVAKVCVKLKLYNKGYKINKDVALLNSENQLLRWTVKDNCFNGILLFILDSINNNKDNKSFNYDILYDEHDSFKNITNIYTTDKACKLVDDIIRSIVDNNMDTFKGAVMYYDSITQLDPDTKDMLKIIEEFIKQKIHAPPDLNNDNDNDNDDDKIDDKNININLQDEPQQKVNNELNNVDNSSDDKPDLNEEDKPDLNEEQELDDAPNDNIVETYEPNVDQEIEYDDPAIKENEIIVEKEDGDVKKETENVEKKSTDAEIEVIDVDDEQVA